MQCLVNEEGNKMSILFNEILDMMIYSYALSFFLLNFGLFCFFFCICSWLPQLSLRFRTLQSTQQVHAISISFSFHLCFFLSDFFFCGLCGFIDASFPLVHNGILNRIRSYFRCSAITLQCGIKTL